jgi:hypothetical protein
MRTKLAIALLLALVCVAGCADVDPSASTGAYDDEADSHAAERAKVVHADAGQPAAETPDSAATAPDASAPAVEPTITATAPDANVAPAQAPDAGTSTVQTSAPDAGALVVVVQPSKPAYDGRPIHIATIGEDVDLRITIHVGTSTTGWPDTFDLFDLTTGRALTGGRGGIDNANSTGSYNVWVGYTDTWRIELRFNAAGQVQEHVRAWHGGMTFTSDDGDALLAQWSR